VHTHSNNIHHQSCWHSARHGVSTSLAREYSQHMISYQWAVMLLCMYPIWYCVKPSNCSRHPLASATSCVYVRMCVVYVCVCVCACVCVHVCVCTCMCVRKDALLTRAPCAHEVELWTSYSSHIMRSYYSALWSAVAIIPQSANAWLCHWSACVYVGLILFIQ